MLEIKSKTESPVVASHTSGVSLIIWNTLIIVCPHSWDLFIPSVMICSASQILVHMSPASNPYIPLMTLSLSPGGWLEAVQDKLLPGGLASHGQREGRGGGDLHHQLLRRSGPGNMSVMWQQDLSFFYLPSEPILH